MTPDQSLLETIGIITVTAAAAVFAARRLQAPSIVAYIFVGLLLGPGLQVLPGGHSEGGTDLEVISDLGIVLLLFLVGLELSLDKVRDVGKVAIAAGVGQVLFTAAGGTLLSILLQFSWIESIFIATALTFSSTVVVVKVLDQKGELDSVYGRIAVGIFLVQDLVVIVILTVVAGLESAGTTGVGSIAMGVGRAFMGIAVLLTLVLLAAKYALPRPFAWIAQSPRTLVIWSLSWCLLLVVLADGLGLSREIGAFLGGVSLAQLQGASDLRRRVRPLMNFFIAVFFVSLAAQMQLDAAADHWAAAVVLSLFVLIGNPFIFMWIIARFGYSERTCFYTSVTVAQISEFSFVFAAIGMSAGFIDESILSLIAIVGIVTIIGSVYMMLHNRWLYERAHRSGVLRMFGAASDAGGHAQAVGSGVSTQGHVVIVGMNAMGRLLAEELHRRGEDVLAIDTDRRKLMGLPCRTLIGDVQYPSILQEADLFGAKLAITTLRIEEANKLFVYRCKEQGVPVAVHVIRGDMADDFERMKPDFIIDSKAVIEKQLGEALGSVERPPA